MSKSKITRAKRTKSTPRLVKVSCPDLFEGEVEMPVFTKLKTGAREALIHELRVSPAADWLEEYVDGIKDLLLDTDDEELQAFLEAWIQASEGDLDSPAPKVTK